jgi:predicted CoA-binding protein
MTTAADGLVCALPDRSTQEEIRAFQDANVIREILHTSRTIAIVGLSSNTLRPSNYVGFYLQRHGYRVIPVNPNEREALGETAYPTLADVPVPIDVVDVFRASQFVPDIAEQAVAVGARALWLQFGVINLAGAQIAQRGGLKVVMDRCMKVEHARHMGRMHWLGFNTGVVISQRNLDAR